MDKRDLHVMRARPRRFIDHPQARLLEFRNPCRQIIDGERQVMQSFTTFIEEALNGAGRVGRLEQLQAHVANPKESDANLLTWNVFDTLEFGAELALVKRPLCVDRADGDSDMIEGFDRLPDGSSFEFDQHLADLHHIARRRIHLGDLTPTRCRTATSALVGFQARNRLMVKSPRGD